MGTNRSILGENSMGINSSMIGGLESAAGSVAFDANASTDQQTSIFTFADGTDWT